MPKVQEQERGTSADLILRQDLAHGLRTPESSRVELVVHLCARHVGRVCLTDRASAAAVHVTTRTNGIDPKDRAPKVDAPPQPSHWDMDPRPPPTG
jgi:hypothetical protein